MRKLNEVRLAINPLTVDHILNDFFDGEKFISKVIILCRLSVSSEILRLFKV